MADRHTYEPVISSKAAAFLVLLSKARELQRWRATAGSARQWNVNGRTARWSSALTIRHALSCGLHRGRATMTFLKRHLASQLRFLRRPLRLCLQGLTRRSCAPASLPFTSGANLQPFTPTRKSIALHIPEHKLPVHRPANAVVDHRPGRPKRHRMNSTCPSHYYALRHSARSQPVSPLWACPLMRGDSRAAPVPAGISRD